MRIIDIITMTKHEEQVSLQCARLAKEKNIVEELGSSAHASLDAAEDASGNNRSRDSADA